MVKHKWKEDVCVNCGIRREKKLVRTYVRTHSYLSRSGIFEDKDIFEERPRYVYFDLDGQGMGADRPDCINP